MSSRRFRERAPAIEAKRYTVAQLRDGLDELPDDEFASAVPSVDELLQRPEFNTHHQHQESPPWHPSIA